MEKSLEDLNLNRKPPIIIRLFSYTKIITKKSYPNYFIMDMKVFDYINLKNTQLTNGLWVTWDSNPEQIG